MFRDAMLLADQGRWSARDLDDMDAVLYEVMRKIQKAVRSKKVVRG